MLKSFFTAYPWSSAAVLMRAAKDLKALSLTYFPALSRTSVMMSMYQIGVGAKVSTTRQIFPTSSVLKCESSSSRNPKKSDMKTSTFFSLTSSKASSRALVLIEMSVSLMHSMMTDLCLSTALASRLTTRLRVCRAANLRLLSLLPRNFPRMFTARTLSPPTLPVSMIVLTHSYSTELPAVLEGSVLEATSASTSDIRSVRSVFPFPITRIRCRIFCWMKHVLTTGCMMHLRNMRTMTSSLSAYQETASGSCLQISTPRSMVPCRLTMQLFFRSSSASASSLNSTASSGHFWIRRTAHTTAFSWMGWLLDSMSFRTSMERSRAISVLQRLASAPRAVRTTKSFFEFRSTLREFVSSMRISWLSSSRDMRPRYPILFSAYELLLFCAINFRHSICPKCVG